MGNTGIIFSSFQNQRRLVKLITDSQSSQQLETNLVIDVFNHFDPKEYLDMLPKPLNPGNKMVLDTLTGIHDLDFRIKEMDKNGVDVQIISLAVPFLDDIQVPVPQITKIQKTANDGIARVARESKGRTIPIATVSLLDVGAAIDELQRCMKDLGMLGVQIYSNCRGKPLDSKEFDPFYAKLNQLGGGLWLHPAWMRTIYEWMNEYNMNMMMGWGIDTSLAMYRLMRSGIFEKYPTMKIICHHLGALIPLQARRIAGMTMGQGENGKPPAPLTRSAMDSLKMFYVDTAEGTWKPTLILGESFFGASHTLFGTDYPWGDTKLTIENIKSLNISQEEKEMILSGNAKKLFKM